MSTPKPGSDHAIQQGCACPVLDNHHGHGFTMNGETVYWISESCPLHGKRNNREDADERDD